jgi:hypothetical protein
MGGDYTFGQAAKCARLDLPLGSLCLIDHICFRIMDCLVVVTSEPMKCMECDNDKRASDTLKIKRSLHTDMTRLSRSARTSKIRKLRGTYRSNQVHSLQRLTKDHL